MPYNSRQGLVILGLIVVLISIPVTSSLIQKNPHLIGQAASSCQFQTSPGATAAFCDSFDTASPGGRGVDIDDAKWATTRTAPQGIWGNKFFLITDGDHAPCDSSLPLKPFQDTRICNGQLNLGVAAQNYGLNSYRIRQPFDFTGRTGTITADFDASTLGGGGDWISIDVSDEPVPVNFYAGGIEGNLQPRNGININFMNNFAGNTATTCPQVYTYLNFRETSYDAGFGNCINTVRDQLNHVEVRLSKTHVDIYASDNGGSNFHLLLSYSISLPFEKGYVHIEGHNHALNKYHGYFNDVVKIDNVGFDGPVLPTERSYQIPDTNDPDPGDSGTNIGFSVDPTGKSFTLNNVDLTNATSASITLTSWWENSNWIYGNTFAAGAVHILYRFNSGTWHTQTLDADQQYVFSLLGNPGSGMISQVIPVTLSDLRQGTNTLEFSFSADSGYDQNFYDLANIELLVNTSSTTPPTCTKVADLNCDNQVNILDLSILLSRWNTTDATSDLNHDGKVTVFDLSILLSKWGS